jgi:type IV secretory pathway TraG/TraD family ATPase VirD4
MASSHTGGAGGLYNLPTRGRSAARAVWAGLFIGFAGIVLSIWLGTEFAAWRLAFQPALSVPYRLGTSVWPTHLFGWIYLPWAGFFWNFNWATTEAARPAFTGAEAIWIIGSFLAVFAAAIYVYIDRGGEDVDLDIHGSAHFATDAEVEATGLIGKGHGVYIGAYTDTKTGKTKYLRHDGPEHILAFAPTRCLDGDTRVILIDGSTLPIREMAERHAATGEQFDVLAYDIDGGTLARSRAHGAFESGTKKCVEILLANGKRVVADEHHPMLLFSGEWKPAGKLHLGDSLMPVGEGSRLVAATMLAQDSGVATLAAPTVRLSVEDVASATVILVKPVGARLTYDLTCDPHANFALDAGVIVHNSGKGVGLVLPTLLSWPHSVLVHDIKGENYALSAGWRALPRSEGGAGTIPILFDPTNSTFTDNGPSARFNPLEEIRLRTGDEIKDVQNIATMIVDPDGKGLNDHWAKTGFSLLVGTILHVLYSEKDKTLRGVAAFLSNPGFTTVDQIFECMMNEEHDKTDEMGWKTPEGRPTTTHPVIAQSAKDMLNKSANEKSGVLSTAMSFLTLYRDPIVAGNTEVSDFKISDLMNCDQPVSLYLVVPPSDKDRLKPLVRLIINQTVRTLTEKMSFKDGRSQADYKHRLLLLIDELPALGKLDILQESLAFIAGYGLKAYLITQDLTQLHQAYTKDESIISNCHVRIAFAPNKVETAKLLSEMAGTMTVHNTNRSFSGSRLKPTLASVNVSDSYTSRPLLTPDEAMRLSPDEGLVFLAGHAPIKGPKIKYYADPVFDKRSKIPPPPTGRTRGIETVSGESGGDLPARPSPSNPSADRDLALPGRARAQTPDVSI